MVARGRSTRRKVLKALGASGAIGLAGCAGEDGGGNGNGDTTTTTTEDSGGGNGGTTTQEGEWPDLSGQTVRFINGETAPEAREFWEGTLKPSFEDATGAELILDYVGRDVAPLQRISQLIQAGDPPEVFLMTGREIGLFHGQGQVVPVTDLLDRVTDQLGPTKANTRVQLDGEDWQIPTFAYGVTQYVRTDVVDWRPETWDEFMEWLEEADGVGDRHGGFVPAGAGPQRYQIPTMAWNRGLQLVGWDGDRWAVKYNSGSEREKTIQTLKELKEHHSYGPNTTDAGFGEWSNAVAAGVSNSTGYIGLRPVLKAFRQERDFARDLKPIAGGGYPTHPNEGPEKSAMGVLKGWGVFKDSNVDAAKTFIEYTMTEHVNEMMLSVDPAHHAPAYQDILGSEEYFGGLESKFDDLGWDVDMSVIEEYQAAPFQSAVFGTTARLNPFAQQSYSAEPFTNMVRTVLVRDTPPGEAIDQYASQHQAELDEVQGE